MPELRSAEVPIPISAVQHAVYCLRQAALIHIERLWDENRFTAEGDVLHAVADKGGRRKARGMRRVLSLPVGSTRLNLSGVADWSSFCRCLEAASRPIRSNTSAASQSFIAQTKRSFVPRPCVLRK